MGEIFIGILKCACIICAGQMLLSLACGTIFGAYFSCKKKYMKEMNQLHD